MEKSKALSQCVNSTLGLDLWPRQEGLMAKDLMVLVTNHRPSRVLTYISPSETLLNAT